MSEIAMSVSERVSEVIAQYGGVRPAARALDIDAAYLTRLRDGYKNHPSAAILKKLKMKKCVSYVKVTPGW